jgi:hypothetical protein
MASLYQRFHFENQCSLQIYIIKQALQVMLKVQFLEIKNLLFVHVVLG